MLISYLHNFVFIKTQKTGGTTVETAFANFCGPDDVVTPLGRKDELERSNGRPICRNFESSPELEKAYIDALLADEPVSARRKDMKFYAHMPAESIKSRVDPVFWDRAFKFTIERHPYEKAVSKAYFRLGPGGNVDELPEQLDRVLEKERYSCFKFYAINGAVVADDIMKLENLEADLSRVARKIGVQLPKQLLRMKSNTRKDQRPAREILSEAQKARIYEVCRREFDLLGYEP